MTGEVYALLASVAYGVAGVTIMQGRGAARGDNGVFLSVLVTAGLSFGVWLGWGAVPARTLLAPEAGAALALFVGAGLLSTVLGRVTMYRSTERIGAVRASLLRRLTPVFALFFAALLIGEWPDLRALFGGALILAGVLLYWQRPRGPSGRTPKRGLMLGVASAGVYALAYTLRSLGLDDLPDAALGTLIGAVIGALWFLGAASVRRGVRDGLSYLLRDHGRWHWVTALALSLGQTLQFFALKSAPVSTVAVLGTLEVFFSAALMRVLLGAGQIALARLLIAGLVAASGTALLFG